MKLAILTIATKKYNVFIRPLIESVGRFMNTKDKKDFFVFSDDSRCIEGLDNCKFNKINHEPWPFITLYRFRCFSKIYKELSSYDFILYMDSDLEVVQDIEIDFSKIKILGVHHPGSLLNPAFFPVERNKKSTAFTPKTEKIYHQGCLWGADKNIFFDMNDELTECVNIDVKNKVMASWHDESHLNRYLVDNWKEVSTLNSGFAYPENWNLPCKKMIIHKDKNYKDYPRFEGGNIK